MISPFDFAGVALGLGAEFCAKAGRHMDAAMQSTKSRERWPVDLRAWTKMLSDLAFRDAGFTAIANSPIPGR